MCCNNVCGDGSYVAIEMLQDRLEKEITKLKSDATKKEAAALLCMADNEVSKYVPEYRENKMPIDCKNCPNQGTPYNDCARIAVKCFPKLKMVAYFSDISDTEEDTLPQGVGEGKC